jgi:hypothetical protein
MRMHMPIKLTPAGPHCCLHHTPPPPPPLPSCVQSTVPESDAMYVPVSTGMPQVGTPRPEGRGEVFQSTHLNSLKAVLRPLLQFRSNCESNSALARHNTAPQYNQHQHHRSAVTVPAYPLPTLCLPLATTPSCAGSTQSLLLMLLPRLTLLLALWWLNRAAVCTCCCLRLPVGGPVAPSALLLSGAKHQGNWCLLTGVQPVWVRK